jgi:nitroreductase
VSEHIKYVKPRMKSDSEIHELLESRWSPRAFSDEKLEEADVMRIIEAARWSPSAANEQPWRFIYALREDAEKFGKIVECLDAGNKVWAKDASLLIVTVVKTNFDYKNRLNKWAYHDLGLAVGSMMVQITSMGLYAHNMGGVNTAMIKDKFGVKEGYEPLTAIAVGHLGDRAKLSDELRQREESLRDRILARDLIIG